MQSRLTTFAYSTMAAAAITVVGGLAQAQTASQQPETGEGAQQEAEQPAPSRSQGIVDLRSGDSLTPIFEEAQQINQFAQASQEQVGELASEAGRLLREYQTVLREIESLEAYNAQQRAVVRDQEQQISEIQTSINDVVSIRREITPLMLRMITALEQFVELDVPFLLEQRRDRVQNLKEFMDASDISPAEKFRLVLEAYQVEAEFGRTIETYRSSVNVDGQDRQVDILRIGRVVLAYRTLDGERQGFWNKRTEQWEPLGPAFGNSIERAMRFANNQAAPNMYLLPVPGPAAAQAQE